MILLVKFPKCPPGKGWHATLLSFLILWRSEFAVVCWFAIICVLTILVDIVYHIMIPYNAQMVVLMLMILCSLFGVWLNSCFAHYVIWWLKSSIFPKPSRHRCNILADLGVSFVLQKICMSFDVCNCSRNECPPKRNKVNCVRCFVSFRSRWLVYFVNGSFGSDGLRCKSGRQIVLFVWQWYICLSVALEISLKMSLMTLQSIPLVKAASVTAGVTAGIVALVWHEDV